VLDVENGEDDYASIFVGVVNAVWEATQKRSSYCSTNDRELVGTLGDVMESPMTFDAEFNA
jgi:hypothetical protein